LEWLRSTGLEPFYRAYAHEALARAARGLGDTRAALAHLKSAWDLAGAVKDGKAHRALEADLESLGSPE